MDDPLVRYVSALRGSGYKGVSIRQLLTMNSGVRWDETCTDPKSDHCRMLDLQINGKPCDLLRYQASLPRAAAPGTA